MDKSLNLPLDIIACLLSLLRNFKLCLCSKLQLDAYVCLWRVSGMRYRERWGKRHVSPCSCCLPVCWMRLGCNVWCAVVCAHKVKGRGLCVPRSVRIGEGCIEKRGRKESVCSGAGAPLIQWLMQSSRENAQALLPPVMVHFSLSLSLFPFLPPSLCLSAPFVLQTDL